MGQTNSFFSNILPRIASGAFNDTKNAYEAMNPVMSTMMDPAFRDQEINAVMHPIQTAKNMAQGGVAPLGGKFENGGIDFNLGRAANNAIDHPVNTAMMVALPAIDSLSGGGAGLDQTTPETAVPGGLKAMGNRWLSSQYKVSPTNAAKLDLPGTVAKLADNGHTSLKSVSDAADQITGSTGIISKMTRDAVSKAKPVNLGVVLDASGRQTGDGLINVAKSLLDQGEFIPEAAANKFLTVVNRGIENTVTKDLPKGGDPLATYDFIKSLESKASQYSRSQDIGAQQLGNVYKQMGAELKSRLFTDSGADQIGLNTVKTPENLQKLQDISPKLAQDVMSAKTVSELRSLAAPYVRGGILTDMTANRSGSEPISLPQSVEIGSSFLTGNPIPAAIAALTTNMGKNVVGSGLRTMGHSLPGELPPIASTGVMGAGLALGLNSQNNNNNKKPTKYDKHDGSISNPVTNVKSVPTQGVDSQGYFSTSNIPPTVGAVKLNQDGTVTAPAPTMIKDRTGQVIAIDQNSANKQIKALNDANAKLDPKAHDTVNDPSGATQAQGQIAQNKEQLASLKNTLDTTKPLFDGYTHLNKITGKTATALQTLNSTSPNLANLNGAIDDIKNNLDPEYAGLKQQLIGIQKEIGGGNLDVKTKDSLKSVLETINQQNVLDYLKLVQTFTGEVPTSSQPTGQMNFPPQSSPLPPVQSAPMNWQANNPAVNALMPSGGLPAIH